MAYVEGELRNQVILFPEAIDDYIKADNPVQFIDIFVNELDFKELGFKYAELKATGRPPYNPADMLKLYIYGYLNRVRSSRCLEKESNRNLELMWLLKKLTPDFKTIADFRKDNKEALRGVYKRFNLLCKFSNLFGGELIAVDGSKFKAVNSTKRNFNEKMLKKKIKEIDKSINDYLDELDKNDKEEDSVPEITAEKLKKKIKDFKERKIKYEKLLQRIKESGEKQISLTDADCRKMLNGQKFDMYYNVQVAVDSKHKLIVDYEVTNDCTDQNQLRKMSEKAKEALGKETIMVTADKGYFNSLEIKKCLGNGIMPYVPEPKYVSSRGKGIPTPLFYENKFKYNKESDEYLCPENNKLIYKNTITEHGKNMRIYKSTGCTNCESRNLCTKDKQGRRIQRWEDEEILDDMRDRVKNEPDIVNLRKCIVEHVFGTVKRGFNQGYVLMKGLKKVTGEMGLTALAYNMKRVLNILGTRKLIMALG